MKQMVIFALLFSVAYAIVVIHAPAAAIVASAPVFTKTIHHQPALAPVQTVERTVQAVQHPSVTTLHQAPTTVLAQAPRLSGYSYTSDVRHDATVAAAPAPVVAKVAAPAAIVSAPTVHAAPALVAESPVVNSYSIETGRTHVATQQHYGIAHVPGVVNVPAVKTVHAAPILAAPVAAPAYW